MTSTDAPRVDANTVAVSKLLMEVGGAESDASVDSARWLVLCMVMKRATEIPLLEAAWIEKSGLLKATPWPNYYVQEH